MPYRHEVLRGMRVENEDRTEISWIVGCALVAGVALALAALRWHGAL